MTTGVFLLSPAGMFADANAQAVRSNATITSSGSAVLTGFGNQELHLVVNITAAPTGTLPTLQFSIEEVDPGDQLTVIGSAISGAVLSAVGTDVLTFKSTTSAVKVSWTITGAGASFTGVYATLVSKLTSPQVEGTGTPGTPAGGVLSIQGVAGGQPLPISGTVMATNPSVDLDGGPAPAFSTQIGGSDGANLQAARVHDLDSGAGEEYGLGVSLRLPGAGGSVAGGTAGAPLRVDPTGTTTQPISATSLPLPTGAATETTLSTRVADATITARLNTLGQKAMAASAPVVIASDQSAVPIAGSTGAGAAAPRVHDLDTGAGTEFDLGVSLRLSAPGGSVEAGTAANPLRTDPTGTTTQPVSATSLPLPTGAATEATLATRVADATVTARLNTLGQKTSAASAPVVLASDQSRLPVSTEAQLDYNTGAGTQLLSLVGIALPSGSGAVAGGTSTAPLRVDPTGTTVQPVSATSLPLPTGAATEATLATRVADATITARLNTLGQKAMAASAPVVIASDQSTLPVSSTQLPVALVGGRLDINLGSWLGSTGPTTGQKLMTNSLPVVIAGDQTPISILSVGTNNAAAPTSSIQIGGSDGTNLQAARTFDLHTGVSTEYNLGVSIRLPGASGSVAGGTSTNPLRVDPTGTTTQPISAVSLPLPTGAATDAVITARLGTLGQKTMAGSAPVVIASDQTPIPISGSISATNPSVGPTGDPVPTDATQIGGSDGTDLQAVRVFDADTGAGTEYVLGVQLRRAASGGSVEIGTSTNPIRVDPTGTTTQPISAVSLPLPTGAAQEHVTAGSPFSVRLTDGTTFYDAPNENQLPAALVGGRLDINLGSWMGSVAPSIGQKAMAASIPVVISSNQTAVAISAASLPLPTGAATEATLSTRVADATITARLNTLGQKTSANSTPVVIASDQSALPVTVSGSVTGTVTANIGTTGGLALDATLTSGAQKAINRGGAKGATTAADITSTAEGVNHQALDVQLYHGGTAIDPTQIRALTATDVVSSEVTKWLGSTAPTVGQKASASSLPVVIASDQSAIPITGSITATNPSVGTIGSAVLAEATTIGASDGTNLRVPRVFDADSGAGTQYVLGTILRKSASGGSVEAGTSTDPLRVDPTGTTTQPISAVSLPLPTGAATEATLSTRLADATFTSRINTLGQKTSANSTPVVLSSDQSSIPVTDNGGSLTIDTTQLPAALVGGRLDTNNGAWLGSTAPTVGQKASASSLPVVIASDQSAISISDGGGSITVDGTVTANIGTTNGLALDATLTGGTQKSIVRGGAKGATAAADVTSTAEGTDHQALDVQLYHGGAAINPTQIRALTASDIVSVEVNDWLGSTAPTVGQKVSASSLPVVIASDQSAITVSDGGGSLTVDGTVSSEVTRWLGSTAPTVGQKTMANSLPVVISSDQTAIPITGSITADNNSVGPIGDPLPSEATFIGGSDGTDLQEIRVFDADTGAGAEYVLGVSLRKSASGGSVELGTATNPIRIDTTGTTTQPVSDAGGSLTIDTTQLPAALVGGRLDTNTGAWLGSTAPTVGQKTMAASVPVVISSDQTAVPISGSITATNPSVGPTGDPVPAEATQIGGTDGTDLWAAQVHDLDTDPTTEFNLGVSIRLPGAGGSVAGGTGSNPIRIDPTGTTTQPISAVSLPLPTGAATEATLATLLADATFTTRINTLGQKTMANSTPVVLASDQTVIPVSDNGGSLTVDTTQLPAALVGGRLDTNVGAWLGSTAPSVGQKSMSNSLPVTWASDQTPVPSVLDAGNSSTTPLGANATFTGTGIDVSNYAVIAVHVLADEDSATDGFQLQWSSDNVNWDESIVFTVSANEATSKAVGPRARYFRVVYENDNQAQSEFRLQTILHATYIRTGTIRINDVVDGESDAELVKSVITGKTTAGGGAYVDVKVTPSGSLAIGITEITTPIDQGDPASLADGWPVKITDGSDVLGTPTDPLRIDPTGTTAQPVTDNGGSLTVDTTQLPAALVGGRLDTNVGAWLGSTAPSVGQKTSANSLPVVIASDQSAVTISGTVTADIGTTGGLALDATLTGGTAKSIVRGGAKGATTPADVTSTAEGTDHQALDIQIYHGGAAINPTQIRALTNADVVSAEVTRWIGSTAPTVGQKTSANSLPVVIASDQSAVTVADGGGSITVDTTQLPAALVGGRLDANVGAWLGSTAPTVGSKTSANSIPVVIASDQGAVAVSDGGGSLTVDGTVTANQGTAAALSGRWPVIVTDGTNTMPTGDAVGRAIFEKITDGTNTAAVKAASTAAATTDPALVVALSPNGRTVGTHANAWNAAVTGTNGTSSVVDCQYTPFITVFGVSNGNTNINIQVSQDNTNFYTVQTIAATNADFGANLTIGARYVRLLSVTSRTVTATIAGKTG